MIRKQTWILLAIFLVLAGAAFYLQKNPVKNNAATTLSPTSQVSIMKDWLTSDITRIDYKDSSGSMIQLEEKAQGDWFLQPDGKAVDVGKVEVIRAQIIGTQVITTLDPGYDLTAIGLNSLDEMLTISNAKGSVVKIKIGHKTPTDTGYYVQVDKNPAAVVSSGAINSIRDLLRREQLLDLTPTPEIISTLVETATP